MILHKKTQPLLETLKLKGCLKNLVTIVSTAEKKQISYIAFLDNLLNAEITDRTERRLKRNIAGAHFPVIIQIEEFNPDRVKGTTTKNIQQLLDFRWINYHYNLLFFGPPGLGKTHLAIALGVKAIEVGYTVCFDSWAEMLGDTVMTTALLDRLLHHAYVFTLDGESYRIKNRKEELPS